MNILCLFHSLIKHTAPLHHIEIWGWIENSFPKCSVVIQHEEYLNTSVYSADIIGIAGVPYNKSGTVQNTLKSYLEDKNIISIFIL